MAETVVWRVFGRTEDSQKVDQYNEWFMDNIDKLEEAASEFNPVNGQFQIDFQAKTNSFITEVNTTQAEFATECESKMKELSFDETRNIGITRNLEVI